MGPVALKTKPVDGIIVFATGYLPSIRAEYTSFEKSGGRFARIVPKLQWL